MDPPQGSPAFHINSSLTQILRAIQYSCDSQNQSPQYVTASCLPLLCCLLPAPSLFFSSFFFAFEFHGNLDNNLVLFIIHLSFLECKLPILYVVFFFSKKTRNTPKIKHFDAVYFIFFYKIYGFIYSF